MAGNLESSLKEIRWDAGRNMPNFKYLNGEGHWSVPPRIKIKRRFRRIPLIIPLFNINRGPPSRLIRIINVVFWTTLIVIILSVLLLPGTLSAAKKVNCPENAEQVITDNQGYQHWKIEDVWYSNRPFDLGNNLFTREAFDIDTLYWDDIIMNPFFQSNDSNLVWYGSGDVDSNNVLDENDLSLISSGISNDQADIDGDGVPGTPADADIFAKFLNGDTTLIQYQWNYPDISPELKKDWVDKLFAIDSTSELPYTQDWKCGDFAMQAKINFRGFGEANQDSSLANLVSSYGKYDLSKNGRFNLPVHEIRIRGPPHHIANAILLGEDPLNWDDWYFIEPQTDQEIIIGDWNMSDSSRVSIYYSFFVYEDYVEKIVFYQAPFIVFKLTDGNPELIEYEEGRVLLQRPQVNSIKPEKPNSLENFVLDSNYPNPFNSNTKISYSLSNPDKVKLQVYDISGKLVKTLVNEKQSSGRYSVDFDGSNLPSGIYLYSLSGENSKIRKTGKMTLLK